MKPEHCHQEISLKMQLQPCGKPATNMRKGPEGDVYPVCTWHAHMMGEVLQLHEVYDQWLDDEIRDDAPYLQQLLDEGKEWPPGAYVINSPIYFDGRGGQ